MPPHPLTNFQIKKYYQNELCFNRVYSRDNLPKRLKDWAFVINLHEHANFGTYWIAFYVKNIEIIYFDSFGIGHVPKEIENFFMKKQTHSEYRRTIQ